MEKCWQRRAYWIINFLKNLNTKSSYKSLGGVWDTVCLNMSWCGIDIGSELKCVTYCSASRNDSKYQWYAGSVGLSLCPSHSRESNIQSNAADFHLFLNFSFILFFFSTCRSWTPWTEALATPLSFTIERLKIESCKSVIKIWKHIFSLCVLQFTYITTFICFSYKPPLQMLLHH